MTVLARRILKEAMALNDRERIEVGAKLMESANGDPEASAEDVEAAWAAEIKRRVEEAESGKVKMIPGEEFTKWLYARVHGKRNVRRTSGGTARGRSRRGLVRANKSRAGSRVRG